MVNVWLTVVNTWLTTRRKEGTMAKKKDKKKKDKKGKKGKKK